MQAPERRNGIIGTGMQVLCQMQMVGEKRGSHEGVRRIGRTNEAHTQQWNSIQKTTKDELILLVYFSVPLSTCLQTSEVPVWKEIEELNILSKIQKGSISAQTSEAWLNAVSGSSAHFRAVTSVCLRLSEKQFLHFQNQAEQRPGLWN